MKIFELEKKINYFFKNKKLLLQSLTHKSAGLFNNERLEFLGDSILNFIITNILYKKCLNFNEGDMSYIRSNLVQFKNLNKIANKLKIKNYLIFYNTEFKNSSILANSIEAIIGAIFLDNGIESVENFIISQFKSKFNTIKQKKKQIKDFKTQLQEYLQKFNFSLPIYKILKIKKCKKNINKFYISCEVKCDKYILCNGIGLNKCNAEQNAAKKIIKIILNK